MNKTETRYFQWISGESDGCVVTLKDVIMEDGETFFIFSDDERCNSAYVSPITVNVNDLLGKALVEISDASNVWTREEPVVRKHVDKETGEVTECVPYELATGHKMLTSLVPPKRGQKNIGRALPTYVEPTEQEQVESVDETVSGDVPENVAEQESPSKKSKPKTSPEKTEPEPVVEEDAPKQEIGNDPIGILVRTCKKHSNDIPFTLTVDLPSRTIFNIAENEFDGGGKKFVDYVLKEISTEMIYTALKTALLSAYKSSENEDK